jgi:hypothetical protein
MIALPRARLDGELVMEVVSVGRVKVWRVPVVALMPGGIVPVVWCEGEREGVKVACVFLAAAAAAALLMGILPLAATPRYRGRNLRVRGLMIPSFSCEFRQFVRRLFLLRGCPRFGSEGSGKQQTG